MTTKFVRTPYQDKILKRAEYLLAVAAYALGEVTHSISVHYDPSNGRDVRGSDALCIIEDIEMAREDMRELLGMPQLTEESREAEFKEFGATGVGKPPEQRNTPVNWGAIPEVIQPSELSPPDQARWDNEGNHTND